MSLALYRNERIPPFEFVTALKRVDENLYVVFDSFSMRWDIYYKNPSFQDAAPEMILRVCVRDDNGRDAGYQGLDDRIIQKLYRMDMQRRNISGKQYVNKLNASEDIAEKKKQRDWEVLNDEIFIDEKRNINRARDALRGVYRSF